MSEDPIRYYAGPPPPQQPQLETLLVDRERMIRLMRIALEELHARRRSSAHLTDEADIVKLLRYWDEVFDWIKQQPGGTDIVLMRRYHS